MTLSLQESVHFEPAATVRLKPILIKEVSKLKLTRRYGATTPDKTVETIPSIF